jgi:hypothetical protein
MFDVDKTYWFVLKPRPGFEGKDFHLKGKVVEENEHFVKIVQDSGKVEIIPIIRIIDVNEAKNTDYSPGTKINE